MKKKLPIGISDYKTLIDNDYAYVDKTLLIEELIEKGVAVSLFPRMRRFGKTLNLSMLRYFFEKSKEDTSYLFQSMKIWQNKTAQALQGQFPVIFLTLKDVKFSTWNETVEALSGLIAREYQRHQYILETDVLSIDQKEIFRTLLRREGSQTLLTESLLLLTQWLHLYYKKKTILLIDEYDTPAHAAYVGGYYDTLITFLRNWLSGGLKDNNSLERGVLTGILRIAKETVFSGLNNITTYSILSEDFQDKFGLLESEVKELLEAYDLGDGLEEIRKWYNGYRIGTCAGIYNPWSVINSIAKKGALAPFWVNTSDNALMKQLITQGNEDIKTDIETLLLKATISKTIDEGVIFSNLQTNPDSIWALLLFSGYLTLAKAPSYGVHLELRIPNLEVEELYTSMILEWFKSSIHETKYRLLLNSLTNGNIDIFSQIFQEFFVSSVSVFDVAADEPEKVYHAFILGMLLGLKDSYEVKSNRESGYGRYDVMLIPKNPNEIGIILEFKKVGRFEQTNLEAAIDSAFKQIEEKNYSQELFDRGIRNILWIVLVFEGKKVVIRSLKPQSHA